MLTDGYIVSYTHYMNPTASDTFLAQRVEWIALGRPVDHPYAIHCAEVYAQASPPAIGFRCGNGYVTVEL